ncbi:thiaminase (transcriptional activator TenA) [Marinobacter sp. DSM 26671]|jgi:thiaminase/transcriptional activator TenA|uniref:thiaminase II n=1 Tax=Marinobacter sp. DSM 26671 TaxID=1761793 RepID=UPI000136E3CD|nr:thiaminase II [Marinobacter sp. DSM 26671]SFE82568.1 thiaminase (transcriptional activator TenA) [Marinobacter sp. DSM 26671]|tara:strand:- start:117 stop:785 length:669 start_codon:yes stop_codon:yes gene_type:complete
MPYQFEDLKKSCQNEWQAYIEHGFVEQLGNATLAPEAFQHYLKQDYLFLIQFARAFALAAYKSPTLSDLRQAKEGLQAIVDVELDLHISYCKEWGISEQELAELPEARATLAYTRYVLDTGNRGDLLDLHVALSPCMVGYGEIANWLNSRAETIRGESNPYDAWIAMYESDEFQDAMQAEICWLNERLAEVSPARFKELTRIFSDATRLEIDFWEMGLKQSD